METKTFSNVQIKDATKGIVEAVIATYGVVDKDGDVMMKGSIPDGQRVVISAYGHKSWEGALPVGQGTIRNVGNEAQVVAQFFMNTTHGADTFRTVQALSESDLQEWSFSLQQTKARQGEVDGRRVRFVESTSVKEVSPTLVGAGVNTRTLVTKAAGGTTEAQRSELQRIYTNLVLSQAKDTLLQTKRLLDGMGNFRYKLVEPPAAIATKANEMLVACASELGIDPPPMYWFVAAAKGEQGDFGHECSIAGLCHGKREIYVAADLKSEAETLAVVAHEVRHAAGGDEDEASVYEISKRMKLSETVNA